jgi:hypothetical protein
MKVYIVYCWRHEEFDELISVHETKESAEMVVRDGNAAGLRYFFKEEPVLA